MCGTYLTGITNIYLRSANSDPGISIYWDGVKGTQIDDNQIGIPSYSTFYVNSYSQGSGNVCISKDTGLTTIGGCLKLLTIPACSASEPSLFINAGGCIVSGVSSGGGVNWAGTTANGLGTYVSATCICSNPNLTFNGSTLLLCGTLRMPTVPAKASGDNQVMYANTAGCVVTGGTVDISTNLLTGDLLYYNGTTISGSTFRQNSATNTTFRGNVLLLCSNLNKCINMCDNTSYVCTLNICGGNTTGATNGCCGGCINIAAGIGCRTSTTTGCIYGGALSLNAGAAYHCYNAIGGYAYGGNVNINAGLACNCYDYPACGGSIYVNAGSSYVSATCTYSYGGCLYLCAGNGYTSGGCVVISAGYSARPTIPAYYGNIYLCRLKSSTCTTCVVIDAAGCISCRPAASDCRLKCNLHEITGITSLLNTANAYSVEFYGTNTALDGLCQYALIAQDIENQLPLAVKNEAIFNDSEYKVIDYQQIIPVLWSIAKEQQVQICCLQNEINCLKNCF